MADIWVDHMEESTINLRNSQMDYTHKMRLFNTGQNLFLSGTELRYVAPAWKTGSHMAGISLSLQSVVNPFLPPVSACRSVVTACWGLVVPSAWSFKWGSRNYTLSYVSNLPPATPGPIREAANGHSTQDLT